VSKSKPCPFCGMRDEACYVNGLNGAKVYQCQWCGAQTICQEDWETRPLEEFLRDKNEILQSKLARERQVSDALYLLLVDDPNTKLQADQIIIDIYGKCEPSPSDVSMTRDVITPEPHIRGGDGSHWEGCEEVHWDCRIAQLENAMRMLDDKLLVYPVGYKEYNELVKMVKKVLRPDDFVGDSDHEHDGRIL